MPPRRPAGPDHDRLPGHDGGPLLGRGHRQGRGGVRGPGGGDRTLPGEACRCLSLALLVLVSALPQAAETGGSPDSPDPEWREGPVRYILLVREDHEYKSLKTDEERRAFIERFWAALDPTPATMANERRVEFWSRVEETNRLFHEGLAPGWKTDRGKVHILLGAPERRDLQ